MNRHGLSLFMRYWKNKGKSYFAGNHHWSPSPIVRKSDIVFAVALRYCRMHNKMTCGDWNDAVRTVANRVSYSPGSDVICRSLQFSFRNHGRFKRSWSICYDRYLVNVAIKRKCWRYSWKIEQRLLRFRGHMKSSREKRALERYYEWKKLSKANNERLQINHLIASIKKEMKNGKHDGINP